MIFIKKNKMKILCYLFSFKGRLDRMTYIVSIVGWMVVFRLFLGNFFQKFSAIEPNPENALSVLLILGVIGLFYILGLVIWASIVVRRLHDFVVLQVHFEQLHYYNSNHIFLQELLN